MNQKTLRYILLVGVIFFFFLMSSIFHTIAFLGSERGELFPIGFSSIGEDTEELDQEIPENNISDIDDNKTSEDLENGGNETEEEPEESED